jgi:hypothetical protein
MQFYGISVMRPYKKSGRSQDVLNTQAPFMNVSLPYSLRLEAVPYSDMDNQFTILHALSLSLKMRFNIIPLSLLQVSKYYFVRSYCFFTLAHFLQRK